MRRFTLGFVLLSCLLSAKVANATAIYDFSFPAVGGPPPIGGTGAVHIELTFPDLLPADGLMIIRGTSPEVTAFSFETPGFDRATSVIGLQITPTSTLFGFSLELETIPLPTFTPKDHFFLFNRTPETTGTFTSVSGDVVSLLYFPLHDFTPDATLAVSAPEPSSLLLLASGLLCLAWRRLAKGRPES